MYIPELIEDIMLQLDMTSLADVHFLLTLRQVSRAFRYCAKMVSFRTVTLFTPIQSGFPEITNRRYTLHELNDIFESNPDVGLFVKHLIVSTRLTPQKQEFLISTIKRLQSLEVVTADIQGHCQDIDSQSLLASALQTVGIRIVHWSTLSSAQMASSLPTIGPTIKNLNVTQL